jgi:carbon monoxide dehydrogenase subunit G
MWSLLMDPQALQNCIPGCQELKPIGPDTYEAVMKIGVAAVRGTYTGTVRIHDAVEPETYTMDVEGKGGPGFIKGVGHLTLTESDGKTTIAVDGDAQAGGLLAAVGQRMLGGVAQMIIGQFFTCMGKQATAAPSVQSEPTA